MSRLPDLRSSADAGVTRIRCLPRRAATRAPPPTAVFTQTTGGKTVENLLPGLSFVGRPVKLSAARAEVDAGRIQRVCRHGVAQDGLIGSFLGQAARERFPGLAGVARAIDTQAAFGSAAEFVGLDGHDIDAVRDCADG